MKTPKVTMQFNIEWRMFCAEEALCLAYAWEEPSCKSTIKRTLSFWDELAETWRASFRLVRSAISLSIKCRTFTRECNTYLARHLRIEKSRRNLRIPSRKFSNTFSAKRGSRNIRTGKLTWGSPLHVTTLENSSRSKRSSPPSWSLMGSKICPHIPWMVIRLRPRYRITTTYSKQWWGLFWCEAVKLRHRRFGKVPAP